MARRSILSAMALSFFDALMIIEFEPTLNPKTHLVLMATTTAHHALLDSTDPAIYDLATRSGGPPGTLPLSEELLRNSPSGDLFGWTQNVGMGWSPIALGQREFLILSTHGGLRADDGSPIALGYHSGHWEVGLLVKAAAEEMK